MKELTSSRPVTAGHAGESQIHSGVLSLSDNFDGEMWFAFTSFSVKKMLLHRLSSFSSNYWVPPLSWRWTLNSQDVHRTIQWHLHNIAYWQTAEVCKRLRNIIRLIILQYSSMNILKSLLQKSMKGKERGKQKGEETGGEAVKVSALLTVQATL